MSFCHYVLNGITGFKIILTMMSLFSLVNSYTFRYCRLLYQTSVSKHLSIYKRFKVWFAFSRRLRDPRSFKIQALWTNSIGIFSTWWGNCTLCRWSMETESWATDLELDFSVFIYLNNWEWFILTIVVGTISCISTQWDDQRYFLVGLKIMFKITYKSI